MKTGTYIDTLQTRELKEYKYKDFVVYVYKDYFCGEWFCNVNIVKNKRMIAHCTTENLLSEEEAMKILKTFARE